jgi:Xaa-Pro aminopeptidase
MHNECQKRRKKLMKNIGKGTAIFRSAPVAVMHNDVEYAYRQDSDFFYLTGFNEPEAVAVLAPHHEKHRFVLFVRPKNAEQEIWTGSRAGVEGAKEHYGADEAYAITELDEKLPQYLEIADRIFYRFGRDQTFNNTIISHWQKLLLSFPTKGTGPRAIVDSGTALHPLRMVKTKSELDHMRKAADISVKAHQRALERMLPGCYEYEIEAEIDYVFRQKGGDGPAYPSIVASGPNSCTLHYIANNRQLQPNDVLLIDAGGSYHFYNADVTRTVPVSGRFTAEQKAIYEIVFAAQQKAIKALRPGRTYKQVYDVAVRTITEGLVELGLLAGNTETLIKEEKYKPYYMHRIGHWIGLDVHDCGLYKQGKSSHRFAPGNVLTVEPGIYIGSGTSPAEGQPEVHERWRGIGVRIEDDVLITKTGREVLTEKLPKRIDEIER